MYAAPLFAAKQSYFANVLSLFKEGKISSTDTLQEVILAIKECVAKARSIARKSMDGRTGGKHKQGNGGAPWFDKECEDVRARFHEAWTRFKGAQREELHEEVLLHIKSDFLACRYDWQRCKRRKRRHHELQQQKELIQKFFSSCPRDFWQVFNRSAVNECNLDDLDACTEYFRSLLGTQPADPDSELKGSWSPGSGVTGCLDSEDRQLLNKDLTREELCTSILSCKNGKAADTEGMTAEALKLVTVCQADSVMDCIVGVLDGCHREVPEQLKVSKLSAIPKCSSSGKDLSLHRGIAVGSIFAKLGERYRYFRLSDACERKKLRCPTQCGFRPEHGTLDAIFSLQHAVDQTRHMGKCLISCLVDFLKAFDKVDRKLMLRRCKELGVHGKFLESLLALYNDIQMVVSLHGELGEPFVTYQGTKQGSELSPLLFGLFIEQLHYLLVENVPGAGPMFGRLRIPDLMYADDVMLMVINSPGQMQGLLDALHLFCKLFGMEVNIKKTKIIIFRPIGKTLPRELQDRVWTYDGKSVQIVEEEKYLGVIMNGAEGPLHMATRRATAGSAALHGMLYKCVEAKLERPDIVCSLFDKLVLPVLSYGCQVWGPYMFSKWIRNPLSRGNEPERVHTDFLRQLSGMPRFVHKASLYKEMGRDPLMLQWLVLTARFWNSLSEKDTEAIAHVALKDNVELMLSKCKACWSYHFFRAMHTIGVIHEQVWKPGVASLGSIMELRFDEAKVTELATQFFDKQWALCIDQADPRSAPSNKVTCTTYIHWVGVPTLKGGAKHMSCFMPRHLRKGLMATRLGCHQLNIQLMRMLPGGKKPRHERICPLCREPGAVEDIMHFMLDCGFYSPIRSKHNNIFGILQAQGHPSRSSLLKAIFNHDHQVDLACCIQEMLALRATELARPCTVQGRHDQQCDRVCRREYEDGPYLYDSFEEGDNELKIWDGSMQQSNSSDGSSIEENGAATDEESELEEVPEWPQLEGLELPPGFIER